MKKEYKKRVPSWVRTKSIRYWAGSKRNKPKHGTPKRKRGIPYWMDPAAPR
ncbi:hypothetical protein Misp03_36710 [Microbispora sp. NBRC 16548]|nr:hypothetical protein Misp03_36710 [Microbispora sp. NBRC 16548]